MSTPVNGDPKVDAEIQSMASSVKMNLIAFQELLAQKKRNLSLDTMKEVSACIDIMEVSLTQIRQDRDNQWRTLLRQSDGGLMK
jgi:hypothetical protein